MATAQRSRNQKCGTGKMPVPLRRSNNWRRKTKLSWIVVQMNTDQNAAGRAVLCPPSEHLRATARRSDAPCQLTVYHICVHPCPSVVETVSKGLPVESRKNAALPTGCPMVW